jgi:ABC-2 type transport system ATP-binding protein
VQLNSLSLGERKKAYICFAIATHAGLLLMDEPTNGLDIPSKSIFRKMIARHMQEGQTVVISTHQVHDVSSLFDEVLVLQDDGKLVSRKLDDVAATTENIEEMFVELTKEEKEAE